MSIIMRNTGNQSDTESLQRDKRGVLILLPSLRYEKTKGSVVSQTIVQSEVGAYSPRVLSIESQPSNTLRKTAVPAAHLFGQLEEILSELLQVVHIEAGILRKLDQRLLVVRESPGKHRLVDEVDPEFGRMFGAGVGHIIAKLVLLLVSANGKRSDGSHELIVPECFKPRRGMKVAAERER